MSFFVPQAFGVPGSSNTKSSYVKLINVGKLTDGTVTIEGGSISNLNDPIGPKDAAPIILEGLKRLEKMWEIYMCHPASIARHRSSVVPIYETEAYSVTDRTLIACLCIRICTSDVLSLYSDRVK